MTTKKDKPEEQTNDKSKGISLEQALKEEGEGRTPDTISKTPAKSDGVSKVDRAMKIMEEHWDDIQLQWWVIFTLPLTTG